MNDTVTKTQEYTCHLCDTNGEVYFAFTFRSFNIVLANEVANHKLKGFIHNGDLIIKNGSSVIVFELG